MNSVLNKPELRIGILSHIPPKYPNKSESDFSSYLVNFACVSKAWNRDAKIAKQIWVEKNFVPFCTYGGLETGEDIRKFISKRKFEHLNLSETSLIFKKLPNVRINDLILSDILRICTNLHSLDLSYTSITNTIIGDIFKNAPKLKSLTLNYCVTICDDGFLGISENNELQSLSLKSCFTISDVGVERIFKIFLQLKSLNLEYTCITNQGLVHIPQGIQSLSIRNNTKITDAGVNSLLEKSSLGLQRLNISEVVYITKVGITTILNKCSSLQALHVSKAQSKRVDLTLAEEKKIEIVIEESAFAAEIDAYFDSEDSEDYEEVCNSSDFESVSSSDF